MADYLCDTCSKRTRNSDGCYVRCRYMGDVKKRTHCEKYVDETIVVKKQCKADLLAWTGVN